jgi:YgiT-type zinc finger domain-containing protein
MKEKEEREENKMGKYGDCSFCGGEVKEELVELDYRYEGKLYVFRNVPVGVCQQCGERYLKADVAKAIEKDIKTKKKWEETMNVPVKTFRKAIA